MGIGFHNMPQDRLAADLDHRLRLEMAFFTDAGAEAAGEQDYFHERTSVRLVAFVEGYHQRKKSTK